MSFVKGKNIPTNMLINLISSYIALDNKFIIDAKSKSAEVRVSISKGEVILFIHRAKEELFLKIPPQAIFPSIDGSWIITNVKHRGKIIYFELFSDKYKKRIEEAIQLPVELQMNIDKYFELLKLINEKWDVDVRK